MRLNTEVAKQSDHVCTITFDFQQNLPLPHLPIGDIFYMQQLWVYVFGVHSCGDNEVSMYCWPENTATRGSDEVISCLDDILSTLPEDVNTLCLHSDGCSGQNKNANVLRYLFTLVATGRFRSIRHTFPVTGHSFLPNDRDFGRTELKKSKNKRVYTTQQWMDKPFKPVDCSQSMFLDYDRHFSEIFKKAPKDVMKKSLEIRKARILEYSNTHAAEVWVKYTMSEEEKWRKFSILKRGAMPSLPVATKSTKYSSSVPVKPTKAADLKMLATKYVPDEFQAFYTSVLYADDVTSDTDVSVN